MRSRPIPLYCLLLLLALPACTQPIEPGSDLEDPAPVAELGEFEDYNIDDELFLIQGTFLTQEGIISLQTLGLTWKRSKDISEGDAEISTTLISLTPTPIPKNPVTTNISSAGGFNPAIKDVELALLRYEDIPEETGEASITDPCADMGDSETDMGTDMGAGMTPGMELNFTPQSGTLSFRASISSKDCVDGTATFMVDGSPVTTTFVATRVSANACNLVLKLDDTNVACVDPRGGVQ